MGSDFFRLVRDHAAVFASLPQAMHRGLVEAYISGAAHHPISADQLDQMVGPWLDQLGQEAFYAQIAQGDERWTRELEDLLPGVRCPASVVWGAEDDLLPVEQAYRLAQALGASTPTVLAGAGHLVQFDAPGPLAAALVQTIGCA